MSVTVDVVRMADAGDSQIAELTALKRAVYPDPPESYPEMGREWATPEWGVFVRAEEALASFTGVLTRHGRVDESSVPIGGIGGVATHPDHRGKGYAPLGMGRGLDFLLHEGARFALLVCKDQLVPYYESLGWRLFTGRTLNTQYGKREVFTFNNVMVGDVGGKAPSSGTIDLVGPAW